MVLVNFKSRLSFELTLSCKSSSEKFGLKKRYCCNTSQYDADHSEADECSGSAGITFEVASETSIPADQGEGPFDNPPLRQDLKASCSRSLGDLQFLYADARNHASHLLTLIASVVEDALDEGKPPADPTQQVEDAIAILNISGVNENVQQETSVSTKKCRLRPSIFLPVS